MAGRCVAASKVVSTSDHFGKAGIQKTGHGGSAVPGRAVIREDARGLPPFVQRPYVDVVEIAQLTGDRLDYAVGGGKDGDLPGVVFDKRIEAASNDVEAHRGAIVPFVEVRYEGRRPWGFKEAFVCLEAGAREQGVLVFDEAQRVHLHLG